MIIAVKGSYTCEPDLMTTFMSPTRIALPFPKELFSGSKRGEELERARIEHKCRSVHLTGFKQHLRAGRMGLHPCEIAKNVKSVTIKKRRLVAWEEGAYCGRSVPGVGHARPKNCRV